MGKTAHGVYYEGLQFLHEYDFTFFFLFNLFYTTFVKFDIFFPNFTLFSYIRKALHQ